MSLDGIAIRALVDELKDKLVGGRIDKIQQPDSTTLMMTIRNGGKNHKLLLSAHPQTARLQLTNSSKPSPMQPPLFCMVMRKHLESSKIIDIRQDGWERIVHIVCDGYDELGQKTNRILIGEFMGKHSNLILVNPDKHTVLDSIKRLHLEMSQYRQIMPGLEYIAPPPQHKLSLTEITQEQLIQHMLDAPASQGLKKILLNLIAGIGPQTATELVIRAGLDPEGRVEFLGEYDYTRLWQAILWLKELMEKKKYEPTLVMEKQKTLAFAPFYLEQFTQYEQTTIESMSQLIEDFMGRKEDHNALSQRTLDLERVINRELERCEKKLGLQLEKVHEGESSEHLKIWGELITANLYQLQQGSEARVSNFYSEHLEEISIPMEPNLTPNENAQKYFKKYTKAKIGAEKALEQSLVTEEEISYLESIKDSLSTAQNVDDLNDIRLELETGEYVKAKLSKHKKKNKDNQPSKPMHIEQDGFEILVGKNNTQNDYLTLKIARNNDLWFHAKDMPGSHVVIKNHHEQREIPTEIMDLAAHLAAYFSKGKQSALVPVDYTLRKNVKKPNGAKPGMVIYEHQKTIYITPDEETINQLLTH